MLRIRPLLVAGTLVLVVGIGSGIALVTRHAPTAPASGQPAASPVAAAPSVPSTSAAAVPGGKATRPVRDPTAAAVATARSFLARELGMKDLVAGPFRFTGADVGEVAFRLKFGEGGRLLPQPGPEVAVVRLQRLPAGWWVLGVSDRDIRPDTPARLQRISSPLTVAGWAEVYEGTVYVKVTQDRPGRDLVLGQGFVTGGGEASGRFRGQIRFRQPTGAASGWVIFYEESSATGGGILQATAVRVRFATPAPRILAVTTNPRLANQDGWLVLPKGAGTVEFSVKATDAQRVRFLLTPTGTGTARYAKLLGSDSNPDDGFTLRWRYPGGSMLAHLTVQATGPGGTTEELLGIVQ
jgi:immunoglobulin-like protein involved in spore germination